MDQAYLCKEDDVETFFADEQQGVSSRRIHMRKQCYNEIGMNASTQKMSQTHNKHWAIIELLNGLRFEFF